MAIKALPLNQNSSPWGLNFHNFGKDFQYHSKFAKKILTKRPVVKIMILKKYVHTHISLDDEINIFTITILLIEPLSPGPNYSKFW